MSLRANVVFMALARPFTKLTGAYEYDLKQLPFASLPGAGPGDPMPDMEGSSLTRSGSTQAPLRERLRRFIDAGDQRTGAPQEVA